MQAIHTLRLHITNIVQSCTDEDLLDLILKLLLSES